MELTNISLNPEFAKINEPLRALGLELTENRLRLEAIHAELLRLHSNAADSSNRNDWENYLNPAPDQSMKHSDLRNEYATLESRQAVLERALIEGRQAADVVRNRLSREPCRESRPQVVVQIRKILKALDAIHEANAVIKGERHLIETAGYKASAIPPAEFEVVGDEGYRGYIRFHFPEIEQR
jgi:hypothetical protein